MNKLKRVYLAWITVGRSFGVWVKSFLLLGFVVDLQLFMSVALWLDSFFFPGLRKVKLRAPIVIVGNPRTGTTFLHRFMAKHHLGAAMHLWRMIYPSLLVQAVLKPMLPFLERFSPARHHSSAAHKTGLGEIETDDPSTFFRFFDGFFLYGFLLAWAEEDLMPMFDPAKRDTSKRDFDWFEAMWRRSLFVQHQDRVLAKVFSLSLHLPAFLERFPDARILYMVRDPVSVVPSGLSLLTGVLDGWFGFWKMPEPKRRHYIERLYTAFLELSRRFHEDWVSGRIPRDKVYIVRYDRMMQDFETVMTEILTFCDLPADDALRAEIAKVSAKQRAYKSEHSYDLERFGLTAERIRSDYAFLYDAFGLPRGDEGAA
jgi:omega-hydroxy-beta-dihydromenaquinone-9 sulfotransferase